jgi:hypothetical protein
LSNAFFCRGKKRKVAAEEEKGKNVEKWKAAGRWGLFEIMIK